MNGDRLVLAIVLALWLCIVGLVLGVIVLDSLNGAPL